MKHNEDSRKGTIKDSAVYLCIWMSTRWGRQNYLKLRELHLYTYRAFNLKRNSNYTSFYIRFSGLNIKRQLVYLIFVRKNLNKAFTPDAVHHLLEDERLSVFSATSRSVSGLMVATDCTILVQFHQASWFILYFRNSNRNKFGWDISGNSDCQRLLYL